MRPNFFLVGATKAGTSSLDLWLRQHPLVGLPARKELHYFCSCPGEHLQVATSLREYHQLIPSGAIRGEASPCYIYYHEVPGRLASLYQDCRILISLRDPVQRFWSHYLMNEVYRPTGLPPLALIEENLRRGTSNAVEDLIGVGMYSNQVARYLDAFPRNQVKIVFLEETSASPQTAVEEILDFLSLPRVPIDTSTRDKEYVEPRGALGRFFLRRHRVRKIGARLLPASPRRVLKTRVLGDPAGKPDLPPEIRTPLEEIYEQDVATLEQLLERAVPWDWYRSGSIRQV